MAYKYKLKSGYRPGETFIPGVAIAADGTVVSDRIIESHVLELVTEDTQAPAQAAPAAPVVAPAPAPATQQTVKEQI